MARCSVAGKLKLSPLQSDSDVYLSDEVCDVRIAVIGAKGLPPGQGGIEHYCAQVYPRLVAAGHSVDIYGRASYTGMPWSEPCDFSGVRVISVPAVPNVKGADAMISSGIGALISTFFRRYDIIHIHALGPALFCWLPFLLSSSKVVVYCHGLDWQRVKWGKFSSFLIQLGEKLAVRYSDEMVVVSQELRRYFWETHGRETVYVPNGPAQYAPSDQDFSFGNRLGLESGKYLVFLGRLVPEKCPDLLIQAFLKLNKAGWKLAIVGGNSDTSSFQDRLSGLVKGDPRVIFTGVLRGRYLAEVMRGAGVFVLPSEVEGLPLAMLEAMQEGLPIVASDIPPHQQLLGDDRGVMFKSLDLDDCVAKLAWAVEHPDEMQVMSQTAQSYVRKHYNWERVVGDANSLHSMLLGSASEITPVTVNPPQGIITKKSKMSISQG